MEGNAKEAISAFAFTTGRTIEQIILEEVEKRVEHSKMLEAKILGFRQKFANGESVLHLQLLAEYDKWFDIKVCTHE